MIPRTPRIADLLPALVLVASLSLAGCFAGAPRDRFYRLAAPVPSAQFDAPVLAGTIEIDSLRADPLVQGRPILRSAGKGSVELVPHRYQLWVDSPPLSIQQALASDLRARGIAEHVATPEMRADEDWVVVGRIARLEMETEGTAHGVRVELDLGLAKADGGELLFSATYREEGTVDGNAGAAARAMGDALGRIFDRFAADLARLAANL